MIELKPCPFCGENLVRPILGLLEHPDNDCILCWGIHEDDTFWFYDTEENRELWNRGNKT